MSNDPEISRIKGILSKFLQKILANGRTEEGSIGCKKSNGVIEILLYPVQLILLASLHRIKADSSGEQ